MAHSINSMAYYGEEPWHGLGHKIPAQANAAEMIVAAGLDWEVEARGARGAQKDKKGQFSKIRDRAQAATRCGGTRDPAGRREPILRAAPES